MGEKEYEYIYQIVKDSDGVYCYIKQGELIRCKDCKHYKPMSSDWGNCYVHGSPTELHRTCYSCDYCSWAKRRTDD